MPWSGLYFHSGLCSTDSESGRHTIILQTLRPVLLQYEPPNAGHHLTTTKRKSIHCLTAVLLCPDFVWRPKARSTTGLNRKQPIIIYYYWADAQKENKALQKEEKNE